jgi:hypothetical protein
VLACLLGFHYHAQQSASSSKIAEFSINKTSYTLVWVLHGADYSSTNKTHIFVTIKNEKCEGEANGEGEVEGAARRQKTRRENQKQIYYII